MPDSLVPQTGPLSDLRHKLRAKAPNLPAIFQIGDAILAATAHPVGDPAAIPADLPPQRVAVLGSVTIDYLSRAVACAILTEGIAPVVYQAPFGAYIQEILDPASPLHGFAPGARGDRADLARPDRAAADRRGGGGGGRCAGGQGRAVRHALGPSGARRAKIIQHTLVPPTARYCGIAERLAPAAPANQVRRLNDKLLEAGRGRVHWVDMQALAGEIGARAFGATRFWHAAKLDFDQRWLPDYLPLFRAAWRAANARAKKVLVLDLDNTLWGGVIGDDGADGIAIGAGSTAGETFAEWQSYIKALGARGIVLAVCSKNNPEVAATGFSHPNSVLRRRISRPSNARGTTRRAGCGASPRT